MISILLATYNWPKALDLCLESLAQQTDLNFEIIIADDGSVADTAEVIEAAKLNMPMNVTHLWQADEGFRKARILNQAIAAAAGSYLIFLDGDCLTQPDFVSRHRQLAQVNHLVTGSRILLSESFTQQLLKWPHWSVAMFNKQLFSLRLRGHINKIWPLKLKFGDGAWRLYKKFIWRRIKGCNLACWKSDALAIHGFDENMTGWGHEDADFVFRLQKKGVIRKSGAWATEVLHLYHRISDQSRAAENARRVRAKILAKA